MLNSFDYKDRRALYKSMKHCQIEKSEGVITIMPTHHEKIEAWSGKGIEEGSNVVLSDVASMSEIGDGAKLTLSRCTA